MRTDVRAAPSRRRALASVPSAYRVGAILATILTFVIYNKFRDCLDLNTGSSAYNQCISDHL